MKYRRQFIPGHRYFFTVATAWRRPIFSDPVMVSLLRAIIVEERRDRPFEIGAAVILPDHLHMIWSLPEGDADYSRRWQRIKARFGRRCGLPPLHASASQRERGGLGIWQNRFWEHRLRDDADWEHHVAYIHGNPVKQGPCKDAYDWPWSSIHHVQS
ncbi:MAG: REP-associated tyrosine transposase [Niveispirillum sp.]|uniref:REP-associated tyrosine transposase n=1 Tax=Niveispirillum sp. TaxID=1917217 RepID=UPI00403625D3